MNAKLKKDAGAVIRDDDGKVLLDGSETEKSVSTIVTVVQGQGEELALWRGVGVR